MTEWEKHVIEMCNVGYDLDHGGYSFEAFEDGHPLAGRTLRLFFECPQEEFPWTQDIVPCGYRGPNEVHASDTTYVFVPYLYDEEWPEEFTETDQFGDQRKWKLLGTGTLNDTDRPCDCFGKPALTRATVAAGNDPPWEFTGNYNDEPWPGCLRCGGTGYVDSPGGSWALYHVTRLDEEED